jgi:hypothetical protein
VQSSEQVVDLLSNRGGEQRGKDPALGRAGGRVPQLVVLTEDA